MRKVFSTNGAETLEIRGGGAGWGGVGNEYIRNPYKLTKHTNNPNKLGKRLE